MNNRILFSHSAVAVLVLAVSLPAGAIEFDTGKWEITMQSQNPVTGQPINETTMECIKDRHFDPAKVMLEEDTCRVTDKKESNNIVTWRVECGGDDMPEFNGEGTFVSRGSTAEGMMKMTMTIGGNTMEMQNKWHGKRVAATCDGM
ncbi:MAG: DUF3617 family protein [Gammaproteobacteria bacterium]